MNMDYNTKQTIKIGAAILAGGGVGAATLLAMLFLFGCSASMPAGEGKCQDGWEQSDGMCYLAVWESTSARGAEAACCLRGGRLAPYRDDAEYLDGLAGGRSFWVGEETEAGCVFYVDGVATVMSCYPQPNPMDYPRAYVCEADLIR
jgi:hypothetical protein